MSEIVVEYGPGTRAGPGECEHEPMWTVDESRELAREHLSALGDRWAHVQAAGQRAEELRDRGLIDDDVVSAAWLHDIGYAPDIAKTGFHPLDGATWLESLGAPARIVAMVASHTGAVCEAEERDLSEEWKELPTPSNVDLDVLTLIDLVTSPKGQRVDPYSRVEEILARYVPDSVVHRSVERSRSAILASAARARRRMGLSDEWPLSAGV